MGFWTRLKYKVLTPAFEVHIKGGEARLVRGQLKRRCVWDFQDIAQRGGIDELTIFGDNDPEAPRLEFVGDVSESDRQRFRNVWISARGR
ncbi:MAG: DUF3634 family protein [Myxococcota bacterium]